MCAQIGENRKALDRVGKTTFKFNIMSKLSFAELAKKADAIVSDELLNTIAGGKAEPFSDCHTDDCHYAVASAPSSPVDSRSK